MTTTIAITTPTGNVGSKLVARLVPYADSGDVELVLLARKPFAIAHLARPGVRIEGGRLEDPDFLVRATRGVDALFWATPNSFPPEVSMREGYRRFAASAAKAIVTNKIAHTVHLSGFAHVDDGGGDQSLFGSLADSEAILAGAVDELRAAGAPGDHGITHLRAGYLFENLLGQLNYIRERGRLYLPVNRGRRIPMVASHDVAQKAAEILLRGGVRGRAYGGAFGPADLSFAEVSSSLTEGLGREVRVLRLPRPLIRHFMLKMGRDPRTTDAFLAVFAAISQGKVTADPPRGDASTTPMSLRQWAEQVLKPLVESVDGTTCPARTQYEA